MRFRLAASGVALVVLGGVLARAQQPGAGSNPDPNLFEKPTYLLIIEGESTADPLEFVSHVLRYRTWVKQPACTIESYDMSTPDAAARFPYEWAGGKGILPPAGVGLDNTVVGAGHRVQGGVDNANYIFHLPSTFTAGTDTAYWGDSATHLEAPDHTTLQILEQAVVKRNSGPGGKLVYEIQNANTGAWETSSTPLETIPKERHWIGALTLKIPNAGTSAYCDQTGLVKIRLKYTRSDGTVLTPTRSFKVK